MTVSGQAAATYTYDANARLRTITQAPLNPAMLDYDAANRRTLLTLPNGVSTEYGMGDPLPLFSLFALPARIAWIALTRANVL